MNFFEMMKTNVGYKAKFLPESMEIEKRAKMLCYEFNQLRPTDDEKKTALLKELFGSSDGFMAIEPPFHCDYGFNIHIHGFVLFNFNVTILDTSPVHIRDHVFIGPNVVIACAGHGIHPLNREFNTSKPITLNSYVWIGANSTILAGVTVGKNSIIGAGSVVTKDIPANVIAAGNPCKVIRSITEKDWVDLGDKDYLIIEK